MAGGAAAPEDVVILAMAHFHAGDHAEARLLLRVRGATSRTARLPRIGGRRGAGACFVARPFVRSLIRRSRPMPSSLDAGRVERVSSLRKHFIPADPFDANAGRAAQRVARAAA